MSDLSFAASAVDRLMAALPYRDAAEPSGLHSSKGSLRIGFCSSLSRGFLRDLLNHAGARPDAPRVVLVESSPESVIIGLQRNLADVGFVYEPCDLHGLQGQVLWREPVMVVLPETHRLARETEISSEALRCELFLASGARKDLVSRMSMAQRVIGALPTVECLEVERETIFHLVSLGRGLALAPASSWGAFYPGVVYRPVAGSAASLEFRIVHAAVSQNRAIGPFIAQARAFAGRQAGGRLDWRRPAT